MRSLLLLQNQSYFRLLQLPFWMLRDRPVGIGTIAAYDHASEEVLNYDQIIDIWQQCLYVFESCSLKCVLLEAFMVGWLSINYPIFHLVVRLSLCFAFFGDIQANRTECLAKLTVLTPLLLSTSYDSSLSLSLSPKIGQFNTLP